uniref:NADH-ubiquinone oxidoreductase chain 5 n=1 Tax=Bourletiella arvalis TaxID=2049373 RepID=A0A3B1EF62_9HEXA|nr:NADH dehydrogenase subunit 5 [Bourletiella arvalis]ATP01406.1 NADH dehydrogenase subunit 5 [Bourletiella arvalis]
MLISICYYLGLMLFLFSFTSLMMSLLFFNLSYTLFMEYEILSFISSSVILLLLLDWISLSFMGVVLLISSLVFFYSYSYMSSDKNVYKFIMLVYLFVLSMLMLILSPNMLSILLGWDGLGLVSYCLVIYYQNTKSSNAGMLTVLSNRLGDVAILLSICWFLNYGSCSFFFLQHLYTDHHLFFGFMLVMAASLTKSAQIPFSAWLPAAMAAPTPVSSLVHSSTLVTAGVYLLVRFHNMLEYNYFLFVISILTMFMSGLGANYETDLKKVIALSTLSQLGVMMMSISLGSYELAFLHLLSHALFKSLLFLCAGFFIHTSSDIQDARIMGSLSFFSPIISFFFFSSSISLCGFPFMTGFYSKDLILEVTYMSYMNSFFFLILFISTMLTLLYSIRLSFFTSFFSSSKTISSVIDDTFMFSPMMLLFFLSISGGSFMMWSFFPCFYIYLGTLMKMVTPIFLLFIFISSLLLFSLNVKNYYTSLSVYFFSLMWNLPIISTYFSSFSLFTGFTYLKYFDQGWMELFGGQGSYSKLISSSKGLNVMASSYIKNIFMFFLFLSFLLCIYMYLNS